MHRYPHVDFYIYKEWVYKSYSYGLDKVYSVKSPDGMRDVDQPPGTIYVLRGSYEVFLLTTKTLVHFLHLDPGKAHWINEILLVFFIRFPSIISDLLLGLFIYLILRGYVGERRSLLASTFYLLGPPIIYNSTLWGQMDSVNNLFFYLSLFFLIKKRSYLSVFFLFLSLFTKLSLAPVLPFYLLLMIFGNFIKPRLFIKPFVVNIILFIVLSFPFWQNPISAFNSFVYIAGGIESTITVHAYNFWWLLLNPLRLATTQLFIKSFLNIDILLWAYGLFTLICLPLLMQIVKVIKSKKPNPEMLFFLTFMVLFAGFLFLPKMHERYLYPVFPLMVTWLGLKNKYWILYLFLSFLHFINLYVISEYELFLFQQFENLVLSVNFSYFVSAATIIVFSFFYLKLFITTKYNFLQKIKFKLFK